MRVWWGGRGMFNLMRAEWIKLRYNISCGVVIAAMALVSLWFSGISFGRLPVRLDESSPHFFSGTVMMRGEYVFQKTMGDPSFTIWLSILFAALFIGADFSKRTINDGIYAGNSRSNIFMVKMAQFYMVSCLVSFLYPAISTLQYGSEWLAALTWEDAAYIFRSAGLRFLLDMSLMSISIIAVFAFRDVIRSMACSLIITLVLSQLLGIRHSLESDSILRKIMDIYPAFQMAPVMSPVVETALIRNAVITALIFIIATVAVSYLLFRRADLE